MSTRHTTNLAIEGSVSHSPGLATWHGDGTCSGHVAVYTGQGTFTIAADTPEALRSLAGALEQAAVALEAKTAVAVAS